MYTILRIFLVWSLLLVDLSQLLILYMYMYISNIYMYLIMSQCSHASVYKTKYEGVIRFIHMNGQ